jgi:hypothetical protein
VVGWTVTLARASDAAAARILSGRFGTALEITGRPVMTLSHTDGSQGHVISWGLFPSFAAASEAVREAGSALPRGVSFLLLSSDDE